MPQEIRGNPNPSTDCYFCPGCNLTLPGAIAAAACCCYYCCYGKSCEPPLLRPSSFQQHYGRNACLSRRNPHSAYYRRGAACNGFNVGAAPSERGLNTHSPPPRGFRLLLLFLFPLRFSAPRGAQGGESRQHPTRSVYDTQNRNYHRIQSKT